MIKKAQEPFKRGAGILLPVSSLPSDYGIGTFGKEEIGRASCRERV